MKVIIPISILLLASCSDKSSTPTQDATQQDVSTLDSAPPVDAAPDTTSYPPDGSPDRAKGPDSKADAPKPVDGSPAKEGLGITCTSLVGTASVTGSVQGKPIQAGHAAGVKVDILGLKAFNVALYTLAGTCAQVVQQKNMPAVGITLCTDAPGTYQVNTNCIPDGGTGVSVQNDVVLPSPGSDPQATSGTITIEAMDPTCGGKVKGSFSVLFGTDPLKGSFDTVGCGEITP